MAYQMLDERCGASVRPAAVHASRICVNAAAIASRSPSIVHAPSTPSAQCAARAMAFGPITPAMTGSGSCTGRGPDRIGTLERRFARPDAAHARDLLVHALPPTFERATDGAVVVLTTADADADGEPAVGQHVDRRQLLRDRNLVVRGEDDDGRVQAAHAR